MARMRKPAAIKLLEGTDRPDRHKDEAEYPLVDGYPAPPDWLTENPYAIAEWTSKVRLLSDSGVLTEADLTLLCHYCNLHSKIATRWRAGVGSTAAEITQLRLLANEFGFTPASRHKAAPAGKRPETNPFAGIGSGR